MSKERPTSLITGASAGIGATFARALAARGHDLVLTARRADRLAALAEEVSAAHGTSVTVLPADLGADAAVAGLCATIEARGLSIDWLINNAGYGVSGSFDAKPWEVHAASIRVLVEAPTELSWRLLPGMRARNYGRIVNVASLAAFAPGTAGHTLYPGSKAYLLKFSQSLALENIDRDIHVCALCPGFTYSEFHDVSGTRALMNRLPKFLWQTAEAVVAEGLAAVEAGEVVRVTGRVNRGIKTLTKLLPDRVILNLSAKEGRRFRESDRKA